MTVVVAVQLNELMDPESGFLGREGLILRVDVLECCPGLSSLTWRPIPQVCPCISAVTLCAVGAWVRAAYD